MNNQKELFNKKMSEGKVKEANKIRRIIERTEMEKPFLIPDIRKPHIVPEPEIHNHDTGCDIQRDKECTCEAPNMPTPFFEPLRPNLDEEDEREAEEQKVREELLKSIPF